MADVFISYASEDRDRVRPLAEALEGRGFTIWWDRALAAGQDYSSIIEQELRVAKAVVVVWTAGAAASTFVRDEAGRARDQGRLVPVLLDRVAIPLGFGSYQAEDFTSWNGQRKAAQVQLLEESIKAKLSGRDIDSAAVQRKRSRLGARIRMVSLLTVVALIVGIAAGSKYFFQPPQVDPRAQLLQLLQEGKLTPEQAIQLAELLKTDALGTQLASADGEPPAPSAAAPSSSSEARTLDGADGVVSEAEFVQATAQTYDANFSALLRHPDPAVRTGALQMTQEASRDTGIRALWAYAQAHPDDPIREQIYLVCGAVGEREGNPLAQQALENAANLAPANSNVWRLLSRSYQRNNETSNARGAALVGASVDAQAQGQTDTAESQLVQALPELADTGTGAVVASALGGIAERRQDWNAASARFAEAYRLRERAASESPTAPVASQAIEQDAQRLATALDRSGRTREACARMQQAQEAHDVATADEGLATRCENQYRTRLRRDGVNRGALQQRAPIATTTPAPTRATP